MTEAVTEGLRETIQELTELFYAYDGLDPAMIILERGPETKLWRLVYKESQMGTTMVFQAYGCLLALVSLYLGEVMTASENYCPAVFANLSNAWLKWYQLLRVLF